MTYSKPLFAPVTNDRESAGCCFYYNNAGQGFYYYGGGVQGGSVQDATINPGAIAKGVQLNGTLLTVGNNGAGVTPLCGSGLPATQPQTFGLPVGVTGVYASVASDGSTRVFIDPTQAGVTVAGQNPSTIVNVSCNQVTGLGC